MDSKPAPDSKKRTLQYVRAQELAEQTTWAPRQPRPQSIANCYQSARLDESCEQKI